MSVNIIKNFRSDTNLKFIRSQKAQNDPKVKQNKKQEQSNTKRTKLPVNMKKRINPNKVFDPHPTTKKRPRGPKDANPSAETTKTFLDLTQP